MEPESNQESSVLDEAANMEQQASGMPQHGEGDDVPKGRKQRGRVSTPLSRPRVSPGQLAPEAAGARARRLHALLTPIKTQLHAPLTHAVRCGQLEATTCRRCLSALIGLPSGCPNTALAARA